MSDIDANDYFARRFQESNAEELANPANDKYLAVRQASEDKLRALAEAGAHYDERFKKNKGSLVSQWGLDPKSLAGRATNIGASIVAGTSNNVIGKLATLPVDMLSNIQAMGLDEEDVQAYNRYMKNEGVTEEDMTRLNSPKVGQTTDNSTVLEQINRSVDLRDYGRRIAENMDIGNIVHQGARDDLHDALKNDATKAGLEQVAAGWDGLKTGNGGKEYVDLAQGIGSLAWEAGKAAVDNPQAAVEYVAENAPQLAVGAISKGGAAILAATNLGYGADLYQQGMTKYAKENDGALPSADVRHEMAINAGLAAAAEHVGDKAGLALAKTVGESTKEAVKTSFKQALLNTGKAVGGGTVSEAATEGAQTYLEGEATLKPATAQQIYEGATIGGIAGGGMSGGARGVGEALKATPEWSDFKMAEAKKEVDQAAATKANDISAYENDPIKQIQVLHGHANLETTTPEVKMENEAKINEIVTKMEEERAAIYDTTDAGKKAALAEVDSWTPEKQALNQDYVDMVREDAVAPAMDAGSAKKLDAQVARLDRKLEHARKLRDDLVQTQTAEINLDDQVAVLNTPVDPADATTVEAHKNAASKVMTLAMAAPHQVDPEVAAQIAGNSANGLTDPQRAFLTAFSASRIAENRLKGMSKVGDEILYGNQAKNQLGIAQYRQKIAAAVQSGNTKETGRLMGMLKSWVATQVSKADLFDEAYNEVKGTDKSIQIIPQNGKWVRVAQPMSQKKLNEIGGLMVAANSPKLNANIQSGKTALESAVVEMNALTAINSPSQVTSGNTVTKTAEVSSPTPVEPAKTVEVPLQSKVDSTVDTVEASTTPVEVKPAKEKKPKSPANKRDDLVGAILRVTGGAGLSRKIVEDAIGDKISTARNGIDLIVGTQGTEDLGDIAELLRVEEGYDVRDANHLAELIAQQHGGNPVHTPERMQEESARNEQKKEQAYKREISEKAKSLGLKGVRGGRTVEMVLADIARLDKERSAMEAAEERAAIQMEADVIEELQDNSVEEILAELGDIVTLTIEEVNNVESDSTIESQATDTTESSTGKGTEERNADGAVEAGEGNAGVTEAEGSPAGQLEVFAKEAAPKGTFLSQVAKEGQMFATYFKQTLQRAGDTTTRPLVAVKDFLSTMLVTGKDLNEYLPEGFGDGVGAQRNLVALLTKAAPKWFAAIKANLVQTEDKAAEFRYKNPLLELLVKDEEGKWDLPENVKTAMIYAGFSYFIEQAARPATNSPEEINALLGRPAEFEVLQFESDLLKDVLARKATVANALGKRAVQALGLSAKSNAPLELLPKLESSIGTHILTLLVDRGLLSLEPISNSDIVKAGGNEKDSSLNAEEYAAKQKRDEKAGHSDQIFVKVVRNPDYSLSPLGEIIASTARGSKGILDTLFSVESGNLMPTLAPVEFTQKTTKTGQAVPKEQASILQNHNNQANRLKEAAYSVFSGLSLDTRIQIASGDVVTEDTQAMLADSITAKNQALEREILNFDEFVEFFLKSAENGDDVFQTPMYFVHEVWSQYRVGIKNNTINPQMSKVVRHLLQRDSWKSTIDTQNKASFDAFKLRILESLGVKTNNESNDTSLKRMKDLFLPKAEQTGQKESAVINAAVDVLVDQLLTGEPLTAAGEAMLLEGVSKGGEKMLTFDGLVALAELRIAQNKAKDPHKVTFDTTMIGEIDGVSNGPILAHLLFGAAENPEALAAFLQKGGFYSIDDALANYNDWRSQPGNHDLYESMTVAAFKVLDTHKAAVTGWAKTPFIAKVVLEKYEAVQSFIGDLIKDGKVTSAGRNLSKEPIRPLVFGSSKVRAIESMAQGYIESIAKHLQKLPDTPEARKAALVNLNKLLWTKEKDLLVSESMSKEQILKLNLSPEQRAQVAVSFKNTFGKAYEEAIDSELGVFLDRRNQITKATELSFVLYNSAREALLNEYIQELIATGELEFFVNKAGEKIPRHGLNATQQKEFDKTIQHLAPTVKTAMFDAALPGYSSETKLSQSPLKTAEVHFPSSTNKSGIRVENIHSQERVIEGPGVRMTSMPIHSFDSYVGHKSNNVGKFLNLHDANATGIQDFTDMGKGLNEALWDGMVDYSPIREVGNSLQRTIQAVAALLQRSGKDMTTAQRNALLESLAEGIAEFASKHEINPADVLANVVNGTMITAHTADTNKLTVLGVTATVNQYASEGASFFPSDAQRAVVQEKLGALSVDKSIEAKTDTGIDLINNMIETKVGEYFNKIEAKVKLSKRIKRVSQMTVGNISQSLRSMVQDRSLSTELRTNANKLRKAFADPDATFRTAQTASKLSNEQLDEIMTVLGERLEGHVLPETWVVGKPDPKLNDPALVKLFERRESIPAKEILGVLKKHITKMNGNNEFFQTLAARLESLVGDTLKITYISKTTDPKLLMHVAEQPSHGWYSIDPTPNTEEIYIMGSDFTDSAINAELLLHEITHAALTRLVASEEQALEANPAYTSETLELIKELEAMMAMAKTHIDANPDLKSLEHGVENIHEFLAWGMTNQAFQDKVLKQLSVPVPKSKGVFTDGVKAFVRSIVGLIMGKQKSTNEDGTINAMTAFLRNTSGLMASVTGKERIQESASYSQKVRDYTTTEIFDALDDGKGDPAFADHLRGLLSGIVEKLYDTVGVIDDRVVFQSAPTLKEGWQNITQTNKVPFATAAMQAGFQISDQEAFAAEQVMVTVSAALDSKDAPSTSSYKELAKLYREMRDTLAKDGSDFNTGNPVQDQALYDFIFKMNAGANGKTDHLARFATLGLTNQAFNKVLDRSTKLDTSSGTKSLSDRLTNWLTKVLDWLTTRVTHTYAGQDADEKLANLVENLVKIEVQTRERLAADQGGPISYIEDKISNAANKAKESIGKAAQSNLVRGSSNAFVKFAGNMVSTVAQGRVDELMNVLEDFRNKNWNEHLGVTAGIVNEIRGARPANQIFHALLRASKHLENLRKHLITQTGKAVLESFANKGEGMTKEEKDAISAVFMRTDAASLIDSLGVSGISRVLNSKSAMASEIAILETKLNAYNGFKDFFIKESKVLGYYLATGKVKGHFMLKNARNIARAEGTARRGELTEAEYTAATEIIDQLVSLYALSYVPTKHAVEARNVLKRELARGTDNGIEMLLKSHRQLQQQSKERLFGDNGILMMKGYTPEVYDPHREIVVASIYRKQEMLDLGYVEGAEVAADPNDPDQSPRQLYLLKHGGLRSRLTGIFSYTGQRAKGSRAATDEVTDLGEWKANRDDLKVMNGRKQKEIADLFKPDPNFDPSKVDPTYAAPVLTEQGNVTDYHYLMQHETMDVLLKRDNRFDKLMGTLAGSIFDKESSKEQNRKAVQALKDQYDDEYSIKAEVYIEVSDTSADAEAREIYRLLPGNTKKAIKEIWGNKPMKVRVDLLDLNFGYRKSSISSVFDKDPQTWGYVDKAFVDMATFLFKKKASLYVRRTEDVFQEIVRETKDILVVKTGLTLLGNVSSNFTLLGWYGVPLKDQLHHHKVALRGAMQYRKDTDALTQLTLKLASSYVGANRAEMEREVVRLKGELARNPVRELIDAGMMPTIVEDVSVDDDLYSYKSALVESTNKFTKKLNPGVVAGAKALYMNKTSTMYQTLSYGTQISDFLAKYTLYQHAVNRKKNPLSHEEAIQLASDAFVNYDIPSHRTVQYLNDMGIVWFTKYYLRIQKVIANLYQENPGRALMLLSLSHFFSSVPTLMDSSFIHKMHNPFSIGAFKYPSVLDELATVKLGMSPFN